MSGFPTTHGDNTDPADGQATDNRSGYPDDTPSHPDIAPWWYSDVLTFPSLQTAGWTDSTDTWALPSSIPSEETTLTMVSYGYSPNLPTYLDGTESSVDFQSPLYGSPAATIATTATTSTTAFDMYHPTLFDQGYHGPEVGHTGFGYTIATGQQNEASILAAKVDLGWWTLTWLTVMLQMIGDGDSFPISPEFAPPNDHETTRTHVPKKRGRPRLYEDTGDRQLGPTEPKTPSPSIPTAKMKVDQRLGRASSKPTGKSPKTPTEDDDQREVIRSRNRAAATRYRSKIADTTASLEAQFRELSSRRASLTASAGQLREEVYLLKTEVMNHSDCDDPTIQSYLATAAQRVYSTLAHNQTSTSEEQAVTGFPVVRDQPFSQ